MVSRGVGDDQVAVELLDLATLATGLVPTLFRVDDVLDDGHDLIDQLITGTTLRIVTIGRTATEDFGTIGFGLDGTEASTVGPGAAGDGVADVEIRRIVEVGNLEKKISNVVDERHHATTKRVFRGDHDHAILDAELRTIEAIAQLFEHAAKSHISLDSTEFECDLVIGSDADGLKRLPVGVDLDFSDRLHVVDDLLEGVSLEVDRHALRARCGP